MELNAKIESDQWTAYKRYSTVISGFIYMSFLGAVYISGNISPYVAIYFNVPTSSTSDLMLTSLAA